MAAYKAADIILEVYRKDFEVEYKLDESPVTKADKKAEDIIIKELRRDFPNYGFLSEESFDDKKRLNKEYCFIIDPLDGTKEFVKRNDEFTINIALVKNNEPVIGLIYIPVWKHMYYACEHIGAYFAKIEDSNIVWKKKISVSSRNDNVRIIASRSHFSNKLNELIKKNKDKIEKVDKIGSSIKGCLIAKGEYDAYYRYGYTYEWDTAAMQCIIEQAGGIFRQMDNTVMKYNREDPLNHKGFFVVNKKENIYI